MTLLHWPLPHSKPSLLSKATKIWWGRMTSKETRKKSCKGLFIPLSTSSIREFVTGTHLPKSREEGNAAQTYGAIDPGSKTAAANGCGPWLWLQLLVFLSCTVKPYLAHRNPYAREMGSIPLFLQSLDYFPANQWQHMNLEEAFQCQVLAANSVLCRKINLTCFLPRGLNWHEGSGLVFSHKVSWEDIKCCWSGHHRGYAVVW